jgi:hypothetical protein
MCSGAKQKKATTFRANRKNFGHAQLDAGGGIEKAKSENRKSKFQICKNQNP